MSKTVTIPSDVSRMEIIINEKTWTFAGGATVTVPDEVAALIATNASNKSQGKRPVENPLGNDGLYEGADYIEVFTTPEGVLRIRKKDVQALIPEPVQELPDFPSTDGTYVLTATVSSGEATLTWEAAAEDNGGGGGGVE